MAKTINIYIENTKVPIIEAFIKAHPKPHTSKCIIRLIEQHMRTEHNTYSTQTTEQNPRENPQENTPENTPEETTKQQEDIIYA